MNKHLQIALNALFAVSLLFLFFLQFKSGEKTAFADSSLLLDRLDIVKEARILLDEEVKILQDQLTVMENELTQLQTIAEYDKENQEAVNNWVKKSEEYQALVNRVQQEAANKQNEIMQPVYSQINVYIREYGAVHDYSIIHGALSSGNILHGSEAVDLTDELIEYINEKSSGK